MPASGSGLQGFSRLRFSALGDNALDFPAARATGVA